MISRSPISCSPISNSPVNARASSRQPLAFCRDTHSQYSTHAHLPFAFTASIAVMESACQASIGIMARRINSMDSSPNESAESGLSLNPQAARAEQSER